MTSQLHGCRLRVGAVTAQLLLLRRRRQAEANHRGEEKDEAGYLDEEAQERDVRVLPD